MGSTNHAFDGGQSQGITPYLLMICLLTGAHGRPQTCMWGGQPKVLKEVIYMVSKCTGIIPIIPHHFSASGSKIGAFYKHFTDLRI